MSAGDFSSMFVIMGKCCRLSASFSAFVEGDLDEEGYDDGDTDLLGLFTAVESERPMPGKSSRRCTEQAMMSKFSISFESSSTAMCVCDDVEGARGAWSFVDDFLMDEEEDMVGDGC
jgi:hypothetical protein